MRGQPTISPIYRQAPQSAAEPDFEQWSRIERLRRAAWLQSGVVALLPSELPDELRGAVTAYAEGLYGPRKER